MDKNFTKGRKLCDAKNILLHTRYGLVPRFLTYQHFGCINILKREKSCDHKVVKK